MSKIEDLLVNRGLYEPIEIDYHDNQELSTIISSLDNQEDITIDCYCTKCGVKRVFKATPIVEPGVNKALFYKSTEVDGLEKAIFNGYLNKRYSLYFKCSYNKEHSLLFDIITTNDTMIKIGQYPSFADLSVPGIKKYQSVLGNNEFVEFSKAIGLFSHGIGIGSYVYLRRILENIVLRKYNQHSVEFSSLEKPFRDYRFNEKIDLLKCYLPRILVENQNIYAVISQGIHELSEDECKELFPYLKLGIELILDDLLAEKERAHKEKELNSVIGKAVGKWRRNKEM